MAENYSENNFLGKWLEGSLSEEELKVFEQSSEYKEYEKIVSAMDNFSVPEFQVEDNLANLKSRLHEIDINLDKPTTSSSTKVWKFVAASVLIFLLSGVYTLFTPITHETLISETKTIYLPDHSEVRINANSIVRYNRFNWLFSRELYLDGEAKFTVSKGDKFTVKSNNGTVKVLGTVFNIKSRDNYFDVFCFKGKVSVSSNSNKKTLTIGKGFINNGLESKFYEKNIKEVVWLDNKSEFIEAPLHIVINELNSFYSLDFKGKDLSMSKELYTGSFPTNDLETALQSVLLPMNIQYELKGNQVIIK